MGIPEHPPVGWLIAYDYLWSSLAGVRDDGAKTYPCVIILAVRDRGPHAIVYAVAMSHSEPRDGRRAVAVPAKLKRWLGLDARPSWVYTDEVNVFAWPGSDLRPGDRVSVLPQARDGCVIARLPDDWFGTLRDHLVQGFRDERVQAIKRGS